MTTTEKRTFTCSDPDDGDGLMDIKAHSAHQAAMWYAEECARDQNKQNYEIDVTVECAGQPTTRWNVLVSSASAVRAAR
jgi:hypothetical protein